MDTLPPVEDINAIVNRFQAWAGSQATRNLKDGVRELTYEEAIGARRSRVTSETHTAKPDKNVESVTPATVAKPKKQQIKQRKTVSRTTDRDVNRPSPAAVEPVFRRVLAQSAALLPATTSSGTAIVHRPVSLSIRVSENEQALIKARATEANLSVSAYLRRCALEVEHLRAQTEWERAPAPPVSAPQRELPQSTASFAPGFLTRIVHRLMGRSTTLAVQA